jgi:hypothetical protein
MVYICPGYGSVFALLNICTDSVEIYKERAERRHMVKLKEKIALMFSLLAVRSIGASADLPSPKATENKDRVVQTKYKAVESLISATNGQEARNTSLT